MTNYDQYDQESQALLHGIEPLGFGEIMGGKSQNPFSDLARNTSNAAIKRKNPLAYSPLSKSGTDVRNNFFQGSKTYGNNNLQITVDPNSGIDPYKKIIPIERGFYYDKNNNGIQDEDEEYLVTIKLFISKESEQLKQAYNDPTIKPDPKEILFFLEDNDKDFSGTTLYIKRGNQVDAALSELLAKSNTFTNYIKSKYGISLSDLQELIKEGVVKNNIQNFIFSIVEMASFVVSNPIIFKTIASRIESAINTIKETCIIEEKSWNPKKKEGNFSPFLFPFAPALDTLDDKAINDFLKSGIQQLTKEAKVFDKKIENILNLVSEINIPLILPVIGFSHSVSIPETFTDLLLMKYRQLRMTMDRIISDLHDINFSTLIKDGLNVANAFFCGIWNGFVEAVCGIISLVQYLFQGAEFLTDLLKNFKEKGPDLLEKIDDIILHFQQIDFGKVFTKLATDLKEWVLSDSTISLVELAYFSGMFIGIVVELVIEIVIGALFTGGTLSVTAILAKLGESLKALGSLLISAVKAPFKLAGKTISAFAEGLHWLYEFLKKGTDEILRVIDEVFVKFKDLGKELTQSIIKERGLDKPFFTSVINVVARGVVYGQSKIYTCAATSLRMVLESKGLKYSEEYLAAALETTIDGARILDIPNALYAIRQETNVIATSYKKIKLEELIELLKNGDTAIVSIGDEIKGSHAIIIDAIENGKVIIRDPLPLNFGSSYSIKTEEFKLLFKQKAVIIKK